MKRDSRCSTGEPALLTSTELLPVQRFKCSHCVLIFLTKLELLEHLGKYHELDVDKAIRNAGKSGHLSGNRVSVQRYQCSHCFIFFASKLELLEHLGKEHGLNVENALRTAGRSCPVPSTRGPSVQRFQCSHCVLIFESKLVLLEHLGKDHELDVHQAIRNATSSPPGGAAPNKKGTGAVSTAKGTGDVSTEDVSTEDVSTAKGAEANRLNMTLDPLSTVNGKEPVANEKRNPNIAKPTSKIKRVSSLAGRVKGSQETSRKITQYFTASSVQNVKSSFYHVTSPDPLQRVNTVLADSVTPPARNPRHGMIKIRLPTCPPRKPHFPDGSTVTLELSNGEEDHELPKKDFNDQQHNGNADTSRPKQMEDNPSKKSPTPKSVRADLKCDLCSFCHKSVVAMFVHYQAQHPQIVITLDQIRRTRALVSDTKPLLPETSSEDLNTDAPNQDEKPTDPTELNPSSGSSERTKLQSESLPEENTSAVNPPDTPSQGPHPLVDVAGSPCSVRTPTPILSGQKTRLGTSPPGLELCSTAEEIEAEEHTMIIRPRFSRKPPPRRLTPPEHEDPVQKESCAGVEAPGSPAVSTAKGAEANRLNMTLDPLSIVNGKEPVANEKRNPNIAKPTSKIKCVSSLAGRVKGSQENTSAVNPPDTPSQGPHPLVDVAGSPCSVRTPTPILSGQKTRLGTSPPGLELCSTAEEIEAEEPTVIIRPRVSRISRKPPPHRLTPPEHEDPVQKESCAGVEAPGSPADDLKDRGDSEAKEAEELVTRRLRGKNLFFCPKCNYGNRLRIVLIHFKSKHKGFQTTTQTISNYTESIHRQMKKSKFPNNNITVLSSGLPVPILQGQDFFFCPLCNYGNQHIARVMEHLNKSHPDVKRSRRQILEYTAEVYEQPPKEQLKFEALSRPHEPSLGEKKVIPFVCHRCDYTALYAYLLKRHLSKNHQIYQSTENVLRTAFAKGRLEEGFHCQWCNFSDKKAERVFDHYKEKHKSNVSSLKHIINHFHMAPQDAPSKRPKDPTSPAMRWAQGSGTKEAKTVSCEKCSFKASSLKGLTKHNLRAHPSSVRRKASAFDDLGSGADAQPSHAMEADGQHEVLDYNLAPQTLEPSPGPSPQGTPSSRSYMCRCCSLLFSTWQGLKIHYGMKHFEEWKRQPSLFEEEAGAHMTPGNVVYQCQWCVYTHTTRHGVVCHCHARHPTKKVRAEVFEKRLAHVPHASTSGRSRVRVGGYMCQTCNEVCRSLKKFNMHNMKSHGVSVSCVLKPAAKYALTKQLLSKYQGSQKKGFSKKNHPGLMKCPLCKHVGKSKEALAKHVDACSKSMRDVFKCTVCSYITLSNKYLRQHYRIRHGMDSKAPAMEYTEVRYNCKLCPYVSSKRRYLVCHYTKTHGMDPSEEFEENKSLECKKCSQAFSSASGLSAHYTGVHATHVQMDFKVLYHSAKRRAVAGYACHRCRLEVQSTRELVVHLDLHREQDRRTISSQSNSKGASPKPQTSPDPAPEKRPPRSKAHACGLCGRRFPSLVGLRVHERRGHGAGGRGPRPAPGPPPPGPPPPGPPPPGPPSRSTERFDQCTRFRPGSLKAFHCLICAYRTNMLCLLRRHFRKKHPEAPADQSAGPSESVEEDDGPPAAGDPPAASPDLQRDPSPAPLPTAKTSKHSVYSEPAEVQRQLRHYRSMAPANSAAPLSAAVSADRTLLCEFCDFSSGHWSSVRRHYMNIHGKKVHRCKDCCFFTGLRRKLDLHKKTGHCGAPAQPPPQKTLRCPLCLYHTPSRDRLVDHVVLHRQERVAPIELRRPKLSRYLAGVVFRCQECTFTCGSAGTLGAHALKHGPAGAYACRLCYFRCPRLGQLEAHLWDKHQVERNHELVGQVNLDHLGARAGGGEDGGDAGSDPREGNEDRGRVTQGRDEVHQREKQEGQEAAAGLLRRRQEEEERQPGQEEEERQPGQEEEERQPGQEEEERQPGQEEEERQPGQEEEERQRRCDVRPPAAQTGSENGCFGGVGSGSKRSAEGWVSEPEDGGGVGAPLAPGPTGAGGGPSRRSSPPSATQGSPGASESRPAAAPGPAGAEHLEEPFLSPEVPRDRRGGRGDELGSPEMPVLENVYLDRRPCGRGSLQRGEPPGGGAPAPGGAAPRPRSEDPGALSCAYCGRILSTAEELQGHVQRHRM